MSAPIFTEGRPDFGNPEFGVTHAKDFAPYVYGSSRNSLLIHKVLRVAMHWYEPVRKGECLMRLATPNLIAETVCGYHFFLNNGKKSAHMCELPNPKAVLCGRCSGGIAVFSKTNPNRPSKSEAHAHLGCVTSGVLA